MRIDLYTKTILTVIALLLGVVAFKPMLQPQVAMAQGSMAQGDYGHMQFSYSGGEASFFDSHSGDVWIHDKDGHFRQHYKIHTWGKDLDR
jgi:hypothetical protein